MNLRVALIAWLVCAAGRWLANPAEPNFGGRVAGFQPRDRRVIVRVDLMVAGIDGNGDKFALVLGPEQWPHLR